MHPDVLGNRLKQCVGFQTADPGSPVIQECLDKCGGQTTRAHTDNMKTGKTLRRMCPFEALTANYQKAPSW